jgi:WD40 repeat protein
VLPDGRTLASGSDDNTVKLWDVGSGQLLRTLAGHTDEVEAVAFSPDGRTLASGSWDGSVRLWDAASGQELCSLYAFDDGGWAVVDPQGRFDGDDSGFQNLH